MQNSPNLSLSSSSQISNLVEVEATPVLDHQHQPTAIILHAFHVSDNNANVSRSWRKHLLVLGVGLFIGVLVVVIVSLATNTGYNGTDTTFNSSPTDTPPQPTTDSSTDPTNSSCVASSAKFVKPLFENDCIPDCNPLIQIDGEWAVITKSYRDVQFFSILGGKFEVVTVIGIDFYVDDIAISGDVAVLGAERENNNTGAAYVYERDFFGLWTLFMCIVPTDIDKSASFGRIVSIDGDMIAISAVDDQYNRVGSIYIYRRTESTWVQEAKLAPKDGNTEDFGSSLSIRGNVVAVGDYLYGHYHEGAVFFYEFNSVSDSWMQVGDVLLNNGCDSSFGSSLTWLDNLGGLIIGCGEENVENGALYYFTFSDLGSGIELVLNQKIVASDRTSFLRFGHQKRVALHDGIMLVGTLTAIGGKAYAFTQVNNFWIEIAKMEGPTSIPYFGHTVAISSKNIFICSSNNIYLYKLEEC